MLISFPPPPPGPFGTYLARVLESLRRALSRAVSTDEGVSRIILVSPNGTSYSVTVDNSGTLSTTLNDGKTRPT